MIESLLRELIDRVDNRHYGKYRGYVHKIDDPEGMGRIQAIVPRLLGETSTGWALPCAPYAGPNQGLFVVPEPGAAVWIEFEGGDLSRPIWSGGFWGAPSAEEVGISDSTARRQTNGTEAPKHGDPPAAPAPNARILKSATGHTILLDDNPNDPRLEIIDAFGNCLVFDKNGILEGASNERTAISGNRGAIVGHDDTTEVAGAQTEQVGGHHDRQVGGDVTLKIGGDLKETARGGTFERTVDRNGLREKVNSSRESVIGGRDTRTVSGAAKDTVGSYALGTTSGPVNVISAGSVSITGLKPDLPSPNAVSIEAAAGNVAIGTKAGIFQLGGMTATSPMILGEQILLTLTKLWVILKAINPLTLAGYGPALDIWLAADFIPLVSMFGLVRRLPVG